MSVKRYEWVDCDEHSCHCDVVESTEGDMVDYEDYAALEQKLADSQREFRAADATIENLQMQVEKLAAENAEMKAVCEDRRTFIMNGVQLGYIQVPTVETDPALETIRVAVSPQEPTPATDAFLAEVRASAIEHAASERWGSGYVFDELNEFAAQIRKGVQS
jgi:hypothetical protein